MPDKKPTEKHKAEHHLDRVDRLLSGRRDESFNDPEEITSRTQVEEIARHAAEDAVRARPPVVVIADNPPSTRHRNAKLGAIGGVLAGIAAVLTALSQCSHDVQNVKHHPATQKP
jgi:hypothetical protein